MKFLLVTLATLFTIFSSPVKAADGKVTPAVLYSFNKSFEDVSEVSWTVTSQYYKADFNYNGQYVSAYYDASGNLMALTRNITSVQLPMTLQTSLKNDNEGMWITDLFEVNDEAGTSYYVTLENADSKLILKSSLGSGWSTWQKQKK
ncbi:MAG: hypothetical protein ACM3VS_05880 [Candidatus Dadabacteria bacterium]